MGGKKVENGISGGEAARPGLATCGRPAVQHLGSAATTTQTPTRCCSAPVTPHRGTPICTLDALNTENVSQLRPVWGFSLGGEKQRGQEAQPLIKDGVMYLTGSYSRVFAVDARTGKELWQYDARLPDGIMPCCDVINRGV